MMGRLCKKISVALVLVAGAAFTAQGLGYASASTGALVGGVFLLLFGLHKLGHVLGVCSMCCDDGVCKDCGCYGECQCDTPAPKAKKRR